MKNAKRNRNAQKWSVDLVTEHLEAMEKEAMDGSSLFLGSALMKRGLYKEVWVYWQKVFANNDEIYERMMRIETALEANIAEGALRKQFSPLIAMMTLRSKYQWNENAEPEPEPLPELSDYPDSEAFVPALVIKMTEDTFLIVPESGGVGATYRKICDGVERPTEEDRYRPFGD